MKKIMAISAIAAATVMLAACSAAEKTCKDCEKITEIKAELSELRNYISENRVNEGSNEFLQKEDRLYALEEQLNILQKHECTIPVQDVSEKDYSFWDVSGTYTGQWKSTSPHGEGSFTGKQDGKYGYNMEYSGSWLNGLPDGEGEEHMWIDIPEKKEELYYSGGFMEGRYHGYGYQMIKNDYYQFELSGQFENGKLSGQGEFKEYDGEGNLTDYGIMEGPNQIKIKSAREEALKQKQKEAEEYAMNAVTDAAASFLDALFR